jgi:SMC interacting uncharacterized protein involved in chromosome segregation
MEELDKQSAELYQRLENLQEELKRETSEFEEVKQMELGELLQMQNKFKVDFDKSTSMVQSKALDAKSLMDDLENNADFITALAMFPLKSNDKKIAFVCGLTLLLKIPFDSSYLFAIRSQV